MENYFELTERINADFTEYVKQYNRYPDCIFISTSAFDKLVTEQRRIVWRNQTDYERSLLRYRNITEGDDDLFMFGLCVHRFVSHEVKWFFGVFGGMVV